MKPQFRILTLQLIFLFISLFASSQNTWIAKLAFTGGTRDGAVSFVIGNYAYVGLGYNGTSVKNDFWRYDPLANTWTQIANFGGLARQNAVAFVVNDTAYVGTGDSGSPSYTKYKDFWKYDVTLNAWKKVADFGGTARTAAVAFSIGNKGYAGTGQDDTDALKDIWEYTPATNTWAKKNDLSSDKRKNAAAFTINGKGYICSGWYFVPSTFILSDVQEYNPTTDTWTEKIFADGSLNKKQGAKTFVLNNKAYLVSGNTTNSVVVYDPLANTLTTAENFGPSGETVRSNPVAFAVNNKGYAGLGNTYSGTTTYKNDIWMYSIISPPVAPTGLLVTPVDNSSITLSWNDNSTDETGFTIEKSDLNNSNYQVLADVGANIKTYTVTGLSDSTKYFFRVKAKNTAGESASTTEVYGITYALHPPKVPLNLRFNANGGEYLIWNDVSTNETYFIVERSETDNLHFVKADSVTTNNTSYYLFSSFTYKDSTTYYFRVKSKNNAGYSATSNEIQMTTKAGRPQYFNAIPKSIRQVDLFWTDVSQTETGFIIERSEKDEVHFEVIDSVKKNTGNNNYNKMSYRDENVNTGTKYFYRVGAIIQGKNVYSSIDDVFCGETGSWTRLSNYPATRADDGIGFYYNHSVYMGLGWIGGNQFWAYDNKTSAWTRKADLQNGKAWEAASNMVIDNKGFVCLGSFNGSERKQAWVYDFEANTWSQKADIPFADRTGALSFVINNKGYILGGNDYSSYSTHYTDLWQYNISSDTWTKLTSFPGTSCANLPVVVYDNKAYVLYNNNELWEYSPTADSWTKIRTLKQNINSSDALNIGENFYFFSRFSNATTGKVSVYEYNFLKDSVSKKSYFPGVATRATILLQSDKELFVGGGAENGYTSEFWKYSPSLPSDPSGLTAKALTPTKVLLTWEDNTNLETAYIIERSENFGSYIAIDSVAANKISYTDSKAQQSKAYYYRVRAKGTAGYGNYTDPAYCMTQVPLKLTLNYILTKYDTDWATLVYSTYIHDQIDGYIIERSEGNTNVYTVVDTVFEDFLSFTDKALIKNKLYAYRIKAYNSLGTSLPSDSVLVIPGSVYHTNETIKVKEAHYFDPRGFSNYAACGSSVMTLEPYIVGAKLTLRFNDFNLYAKDTLIIYDGPDIKSPILEKFSMSSKPSYLLCAKNSSGILTVKLVADCYGSGLNQGWDAYVKCVTLPPATKLYAKRDGNVNLSWNDNSDSETGFVIERSQSDTSHFAELVTLDANKTTYTDANAPGSALYYYRIKAVYSTGTSGFSNIAASDGTILGQKEIMENTGMTIFPNPMNSYGTIRIDLPKDENITIAISRIDGSLIKEISMNVKQGTTDIPVDAENLAPGLYFVQLKTTAGTITKRVSVIR